MSRPFFALSINAWRELRCMENALYDAERYLLSLRVCVHTH